MRKIVLVICVLLIAAAASAKMPKRAAETKTSIQTEAHSGQTSSESVRMPKITPKMRRYSATGYALYFIETAYGLFLLWGVLASRTSARLRDLAQRVSRRRFLTLFVYYLLLSLALYLLQWPLTFYAGFLREHQYGLSHQSFLSWMRDEAVAFSVDFAVGLCVLWVLFLLIRRSPRRWAFWLWAALIPFIAFSIFLSPLLIDPLFNKFTPMPPSAQRAQIELLAAKAGIPAAPIYIVDKSRQTQTTNAYVTGLGSSARIVIWDTTLQRMPPDQVLAVVGHEMGHYVLGHVTRGFWETVGLLLLILPLAQKIIEALVRRSGAQWDIHGIDDFAAVPAMLLTVLLLSFLLAPLTNALSRQVEHEADAFGLRVTGNGPAMARAFVSLSEQNLSDPNPPAFIKFWLFSHPALQERIDFALGRKSGANHE